MREARNGAEVVDYIYQNCGVKIDIITGIEEAKTIFEAGSMDRFLPKDKNLYIC